MRSYVLTFLAGCVVAGVAIWFILDPGDVPDTTEPFRERVETAEEARERAERELTRLEEQHSADSARWYAERDSLRQVAASAKAQSDSISDALRVTLDTAQARMLDEIEASHEVEIQAVRDDRDTWRDEAMSFKEQLEASRSVVLALEAEVGALDDLVEEQDRITSDLRRALYRAETVGAITKVSVTGLATKIGYDAYRDGDDAVAIGSAIVALGVWGLG